MDGLSPIADVDRETEASFSTQHADLGFPDLDVSYGSSGASHPVQMGQQQYGDQGRESNDSQFIENEHLAYFR